MWNKELPSILPKRKFGRHEPPVMQWEKLMCEVWQLVIPFYQWTSTFARRHIVKIRLPASCANPMSSNWWPRLLRCYLGSKLKLAFGKLFRPWWKREEFQNHTESMIHSSHRLKSSPFTRTQPTIDRNILRCNTLMLSKCTFVNANVCKLRSMAGVKTALKNFNRNFKFTCLFVSMVRCLLNFAQAIVLRWCNSTRPLFPGMCLPKYLCEDPSWRTCTKSCDTSTYVGWSNGFVVNISFLAAFSCKPMWCI